MSIKDFYAKKENERNEQKNTEHVSEEETRNYKRINTPSESDEDELTIETKLNPKFSDDEESKTVRMNDKLPEKDQTTVKVQKSKKEVPSIQFTRKGSTEIFEFHADFFLKELIEGDQKMEVGGKTQVILLQNGFYIYNQEKTFVKIEVESQVLIQQDYEFVLGNSLIEISKLRKNELIINMKENFMSDKAHEHEPFKTEEYTLDFSKQTSEIKFPSEKLRKNFFRNDKEIKKEQISFTLLNNGKVVLKPLIDSETWLKLKNNKEENSEETHPNRLYLLRKGMEFSCGSKATFIVKKAFTHNMFLCDCKKTVDSIIFPCLHFLMCMDCLQTQEIILNCPKCSTKIQKTVLLIDIYRPLN